MYCVHTGFHGVAFSKVPGLIPGLFYIVSGLGVFGYRRVVVTDFYNTSALVRYFGIGALYVYVRCLIFILKWGYHMADKTVEIVLSEAHFIMGCNWNIMM